jgi:hypothetical protein
MMNTVAQLEPPRVPVTRLRTGRHDDIPAISRLILRANLADHVPRIDDHELEAVADRGHLIVLPLDRDELAAAACVATGRGVIFVVIDPRVASPELEHRMIAVADALCESEQSACERKRSASRGRR